MITASKTTGAMISVTSVAATAVSCVLFAVNPTFALMLPEIALLASTGIETPASVGLVASSVSYGSNFKFFQNPIQRIDTVIYEKHLKSYGVFKRALQRNLQSEGNNFTEAPTTGESPKQETSSDGLSIEEKQSSLSQLMSMPLWLDSQGIGPAFWSNIAGQMIILCLLCIPLLISWVRRGKLEKSKLAFIHRLRWKPPIYFLILQTNFFVLSIFTAFKFSSEKYAFSLFSAFLAFLFGMLLLFLLFQFLLLVFYFKKTKAPDEKDSEAQASGIRQPLKESQPLKKSPLQTTIIEIRSRHNVTPEKNGDNPKKDKAEKPGPPAKPDPAAPPAPPPHDFEFIFSKYKVDSLSGRLFAFVLLFSNACESAAAILLLDYPGLSLPVAPAMACFQILYCLNYRPFAISHKMLAFIINKSVLVLNYFLLFVYGYILGAQNEAPRGAVSIIIILVLFAQTVFNLCYYTVACGLLPIITAIQNKKRAKALLAQKAREEAEAQMDGNHDEPLEENVSDIPLGADSNDGPSQKGSPKTSLSNTQYLKGEPKEFFDPNESSLNDDSRAGWLDKSLEDFKDNSSPTLGENGSKEASKEESKE